jgi:hypothetical protein
MGISFYHFYRNGGLNAIFDLIKHLREIISTLNEESTPRIQVFILEFICTTLKDIFIKVILEEDRG